MRQLLGQALMGGPQLWPGLREMRHVAMAHLQSKSYGPSWRRPRRRRRRRQGAAGARSRCEWCAQAATELLFSQRRTGETLVTWEELRGFFLRCT